MEKQITLGVIGGLGPIATAHFMELITVMTRADTDQAHLPMIIYSAPYIPDRTAYILDNTKESPLPGILSVGQALEAQGVGCSAIPCITAHYFHNEIEMLLSIKETLQKKAEKLVEVANNNGGYDNITAVLISNIK